MKLIRYEHPEVSNFFGDFDRLFRDAFAGFPLLRGAAGLPGQFGRLAGLRLAADLYEDDDNYYARVELPGVKKDELKIDLDDRLLTVTYEKATAGESEGEGEDAGKETDEVAYKRSLTVPDGIDPEKVGARLEDGILTVTLPKAEQRKAREIAIS